MTVRVKSIILCLTGLSVFAGQAWADVIVNGNANATLSPGVATFLTYTAQPFSVDLPIGTGPFTVSNVGYFEFSPCPGGCEFGDEADALVLTVTFTSPGNSDGSGALTVDIPGRIFGRVNAQGGGTVHVDFDNTPRHLTWANEAASGTFDFWLSDPSPINPAKTVRAITGQIGNVTDPPNLPITAVPEPASAALLGAAALFFMLSLRRRRRA